MQGRTSTRGHAEHTTAETETVHAREGSAKLIPAKAGRSVSAAPRAEFTATWKLWEAAWIVCVLTEGRERQAGHQPRHLAPQTFWR
jgi:hypothetical protein